jgi:hypothetical protein
MGKYLDIADKALRDMAEPLERPGSPVTTSERYGEKSELSEISPRSATGEQTARKKRRDEVLMLLADNPAVRYAYVCDADTDPVIIAIAIRDLATFEMTIPADRYDPFRLLQLIDSANGPEAA